MRSIRLRFVPLLLLSLAAACSEKEGSSTTDAEFCARAAEKGRICGSITEGGRTVDCGAAICQADRKSCDEESNECVEGRRGFPCASKSECDDGFQCVQVAGCLQICSIAEQDCPGTDKCLDPTGSGASEGVCVGAVCDPLDPTECEAGDGCYNFPDGKVRCGPAGAAGVAEPCSYGAECKAGMECMGRVGSGIACMEFCDIANPSCADDGVCFTTMPGVPALCFPLTCDPIAQSCEEGSDGCYFNSDQFLECMPAGKKTFGATCSKPNDCEPGLSCMTGAGGANLCFQLCDTRKTNTCPSGLSCASLIGWIGACSG